MTPLAIDLFTGCFGWSRGWLDLGGTVVGFDWEHEAHHGPVPQGAELVLQDVLTLDGRQFKDAALILASPPCQFFSYCAMPWTRAKDLAKAVRADPERLAKELALFTACFRIQREASAAAGHHVPMVVENVKGAQPWVGRARWNYGSFYLWGDVPAMMPTTSKRRMKFNPDGTQHGVGSWFAVANSKNRGASEGVKVGMASWRHPDDPRHVPGQGFNTVADRETREGSKNAGGSWFNIGSPGQKVTAQNPDGRKTSGDVNQRDGYSHTRHLTNQAESDGVKQGGDWFNAASLDGDGNQSVSRRSGSKSPARKAASARIAMIPPALARHVAEVYWPGGRA